MNVYLKALEVVRTFASFLKICVGNTAKTSRQLGMKKKIVDSPGYTGSLRGTIIGL